MDRGVAGEDKESRMPRTRDARTRALADETGQLERTGKHS